MSPESVAPIAVPAVQRAGVASLEAARVERRESPAGQLEALQRRLETERSAGKAMLVAVLELENRLQSESRKGQALLATVRGLESSLQEERREHHAQRVELTRLWGEIRVVEDELREAKRPLWRKLLRRP